MNMKKIFISFFILSNVTVANLMAKDQFAIGIVAGSPTVGLDVLIPAGPISVDVNLGWNAGNWYVTMMTDSLSSAADRNNAVMCGTPRNALYASVDILFWERQVTDQFGYFIGAGPRINWVVGGSDKDLSFSANIPVGMTFEVMKNLNILTKVAPGVMYGLGDKRFIGTLDLSLGVRYSL